MGSKKSNATSSTTTNTQDNSAVAGNNAVALAAGASYANTNWFQTSDTYAADLSDRSYTDTSYRDSSTSLYALDNSNRSSTYSDSSYRDNSTDLYALDNSNRSTTYTDAADRSSSWYALDNSNRSTTSNTNFSDSSNRSTTYTDAADRSSSWYALDNSDRSVTASDDRSWYSYASDSRDLSTAVNVNDSRQFSTVTMTGTDPGLVQWQAQAAELLGAVAESQTDGVKFMTSAGADTIRRMGESATNLYTTAGQNNAESWGATVAASERVLSGVADRVGATWADTMQRSTQLLQGITDRAGNTADAAGRLADLAITSYQPPENAQASTMRWGLLAVAGVAALFVLPRIMKA